MLRPPPPLFSRRDVMEPHHVNIPPLAVLRHCEQLRHVRKSRFARQLRRNVVIVNLTDGIDFDLAFLHRVARAHLHVRARPDPDARRDFAPPNSITQAFGEYHAKEFIPRAAELLKTLRKRDADADEQIVAVQTGPSPTSQPRPSRAERGFVLIATSIAITLLLGLAGLAIDIGRMYVIRAELQSFTDAAALKAALSIDGTAAGLARARGGAAQLAQGPHAMRWDMGTQPINNIATTFSADQATWQEQPKQTDVRFVRVVATEPAPVIFLRIFQPRTSTTVAAASVATNAGQSSRLVQ